MAPFEGMWICGGLLGALRALCAHTWRIIEAGERVIVLRGSSGVSAAAIRATCFHGGHWLTARCYEGGTTSTDITSAYNSVSAVRVTAAGC